MVVGRRRKGLALVGLEPQAIVPRSEVAGLAREVDSTVNAKARL